MLIFSSLYLLFRYLILPRMALAAEILALRQQLAVLNRTAKQPKLRYRDRLFWVVLSKLWNGWREVLVIVKPETVVKWHRQGFQLYWRWKSKPGRGGRPQIERFVI
jgi:putative transposase